MAKRQTFLTKHTYALLRLEGYPEAELDALAQGELFPRPRPAEQLPLFGRDEAGSP